MYLSKNFLITGLKKISPQRKSYSECLQGLLNNQDCQIAINNISDFKSLFMSKIKSCQIKSSTAINSFFAGNPEIQFYSDNFVSKILLMLEKKGCVYKHVNTNKVPRFLYHLTTKSNYERMLQTGTMKPANEKLCGENIFMLDIKNFFKRWTKFNPIGGSHQNRLLAKVTGKNNEDIVLLKIPTNKLNREKLGIRSQDVVYSNLEHIGSEQIRFMEKYNCANEEEILQLLECDESAFNQFANIFKRYLHLTRGSNAGNQRLFTTRKDAIEYIYPEIIDIKDVQQIGIINPTKFKLTNEFNADRPMRSIFSKLLDGQSEQKGALLIQG